LAINNAVEVVMFSQSASPDFANAVRVGSWNLPGSLIVPERAQAVVIFAHGSGSSRLSPRNRQVADALNRAGMATLLFDLLSPEEEAARGRAKVFDIRLLAERLIDAVRWADEHWAQEIKPIGLFGASTGAAAALVTAADLGDRIGAVVSRGGRPDLAGDALEEVQSPTLLIVGGADEEVLHLNRYAQSRIPAHCQLEIVPGATHLFPEPGAMERVIELASAWFAQYLAGGEA
jgi:putative phosphoribosyl transferase